MTVVPLALSRSVSVHPCSVRSRRRWWLETAGSVKRASLADARPMVKACNASSSAMVSSPPAVCWTSLIMC